VSRRQIDAEHIAILCDIKKKHSAHSITSDVDISEMAQAAEFFQSDGIILTGSSTGQEANAEELENVRKAIGMNSYFNIYFKQTKTCI
jgi:predicted TIM-barrel enzyme